MKVRTVLLTGASGFLGRYLHAALDAAGCRVLSAGRGRTAIQFDLTDTWSCVEAVRAAQPECIVHAAALSSMAACASDPQLAWQCNQRAVEALASTFVPLIQISTDLVFDGRAAPYRSEDPPAPLSVYARTKLGGERAALSERGIVVRLPLLFGPSFDGRRGATDMLRTALREHRRLGLFVDEFRTPLHVRDAAEAVVAIALDPECGVVHVGGPERISRFELARRFAALHGLTAADWTPIQGDDPERPRDVSLVSDVAPTRDLDAMLKDA